MKKVFVVCAAAALVLGMAGCASTKSVDPTLKVNVDDGIDKVVVIDWTDRTLGEVSAPLWLKNMRRGNSDTFKQQWGTDANRVVKVSMATGKTEATAQALSRAGFAYTQAAELSQKVIGRVGQGLNDVGQLEAVYVAASETKADMTGLREESGFFQKVRTTKAGTKEQSEQYIYYTVFSMDKGTWDNLCKKYLMDVMGGADLTTETQKKVGALFSEMKADADKKDSAKQAEEEALFKVQMARLEAERAKANADTAASNAETAKAALKAKEMDAQEAQTKAATEEAANLADFLM
nr:MAG TPA: LPP20 lipoprotein factor [Caudoviricetes sp.]